jgi:mannose-6-phosphate isomerase-like protein (cupin superfamily)
MLEVGFGNCMLKIIDVEEAVRKARKLAEDSLARGENADEFIEIGETDGFKMYIAAGKTLSGAAASSFHENPRDVFMLLLEGEMELAFEKEKRITVKKGQCFVLPKHLRHRCFFRRMTIALEGVFERGL